MSGWHEEHGPILREWYSNPTALRELALRPESRMKLEAARVELQKAIEVHRINGAPSHRMKNAKRALAAITKALEDTTGRRRA